ncbi:GNAT family N-acetyltransferase [Enterococcus sp.]|uniref:GNAT family N-acetyltransferase n=1 Tax=Enterococcus sp. TaxID=35783 RepID=UPI002897926F|nr:GNAT family N-acetyltransferase [Enterococcus sp.]
MELREVTQSDEAQVTLYRKAFMDRGEVIHGGAGLAQAASAAQWLAELPLFASKDTVPEGFVPAKTYAALEDGQIVGLLNLRLALNAFLRGYGGHIGYSVKPDQRQKGLGAAMLKAGLQQAKAEGLTKVLVICDKENVGSAKVIEANGGQFAEEIKDPSDGALLRRYWIDLI